MSEIEVKAQTEAHRHAVALRQCAIFAADAGDHIAKAMTDAADFLSDCEARIRSAIVERKVEPLEHVEKVSTEAAMSQWERSLKRPDLCEKDRVRGAIEAYKRQAFAFAISPTPPAAPVRGEGEAAGVAEAGKCHWCGGTGHHPDKCDWVTESEVAEEKAGRARAAASPSPVDSRELIERLAKALEGLHRAGRKQGWHNSGYSEEMEAARLALTEAKEGTR